MLPVKKTAWRRSRQTLAIRHQGFYWQIRPGAFAKEKKKPRLNSSPRRKSKGALNAWLLTLLRHRQLLCRHQVLLAKLRVRPICLQLPVMLAVAKWSCPGKKNLGQLLTSVRSVIPLTCWRGLCRCGCPRHSLLRLRLGQCPRFWSSRRLRRCSFRPFLSDFYCDEKLNISMAMFAAPCNLGVKTL